MRSRRGEIEWRGAIGAVLRSTRPVRSGACDRRTGAREIKRCGAIGAVLRSTRPVRSGMCDRWIGARGSPATSKA